MITHNYQENLILNPGEYSFDLDGITFNKNVCLSFINIILIKYLKYFRIGFIYIIVEFI